MEPVDPAAHRFRVDCRIADADGEALRFALPTWLRGSYLIRDFAKHVIAIRALRGTQEVGLTRLDKHRVEVAAGSPGEVCLQYSVHAWDASVRKAWLDTSGGFFNGSSLFYGLESGRDWPCSVELLRPALGGGDWQVATSLRAERIDAAGFGVYRADNYEALIDHPVSMGPLQRHDFVVDGIAHALVVCGRVEADLARVTADLTRVCSVQRELFGQQPTLAQYLFLLRVVEQGYGGLEHRDSTALICSRSALPRLGQPAVSRDYLRFLGLCSHEYFHLWNVKRITPAVFAASDLGSEAYSADLWHYEGVTSYYDDYCLLRSGLIDAPTYLDLLAESATQLQRAPGSRIQTLADASLETWIKYYQPDDNAINQNVSYYIKGALVALCLDLCLRRDTALSLDDLMRALWQRYGCAQRGVPEGGLERLASELSGLDLRPQFDLWLRSTAELPLAELLAQFGVSAVLRQAASASDNGGRGHAPEAVRAWLGLSLRPGGLVVAAVVDGSPAQRAGLSAGDELIAIDGYRLRSEQWSARVAELSLEQAVSCLYARDGLVASTLLQAVAPPRDTWTLTLMAADDIEPMVLQRRQRWIGV